MNDTTDTPVSNTLCCEMPCGYIAEDGSVSKDFMFREVDGHCEDLLLATGPPLPRFNAVVERCMVSAELVDTSEHGKIVRAMTANDRARALITIRRASYGDTVYQRVRCPSSSCKHEMNVTIDLAGIQQTEMPDRAVRSFVSSFEGNVFDWHVANGEDEAWVAAQTLIDVDDEKGQMTLDALARLDSLNGVKIDRSAKGIVKALSALKGLPGRIRGMFREEVRAREGSVDTTVEWFCDKCRQVRKRPLDIGSSGFFFPYDDPITSSMKSSGSPTGSDGATKT